MKIKEIITEKWSEKYKRSINCKNPKGFSQRAHCQGRKKKGVAEGDKMSLINLDQSLANTPPVWKKFISSLPSQLAREFVDERPRPDQDDIDFLTPLRLSSPQPVAVRVADLLRHPENQATIGRSPDDVVAAVNQRWGLKIPSGKKYDPNPARYRAYAQMTPGTASPSVMADGVILFGAGRFVAAALRGDETMRVWSMTRKQGVAEGAGKNLSVEQLATISDAALDQAYGYGRSQPGDTFGWQANLQSAAQAKKMIDAGITDIERIADAIHRGWNVTAQKFVQDPDQFADTEKLRAAGKLDAKLDQRAKLMRINYAQLPDDEQEKDRVVARALLQAMRG